MKYIDSVLFGLGAGIGFVLILSILDRFDAWRRGRR